MNSDLENFQPRLTAWKELVSYQEEKKNMSLEIGYTISFHATIVYFLLFDESEKWHFPSLSSSRKFTIIAIWNFLSLCEWVTSLLSTYRKHIVDLLWVACIVVNAVQRADSHTPGLEISVDWLVDLRMIEGENLPVLLGQNGKQTVFLF